MREQDRLFEFGTMSGLFDFATRVHEDRLFIRYRHRDITYGDARREAAALGEAFASMGLRRGDGVAYLSTNTPETLIARDAATARGFYYVTLNARSSAEEHLALIEDFGVRAVIVDDREHPEALDTLAVAKPDLEVVGFGERSDGTGLSQLAAPYLGTPFKVEAEPDDIVRIAQTGGTTGRPKGVVFRHRTSVSYILMCYATWDLPQRMRFLATTPLSHAAGTYAPMAMIGGGSFHMLGKFSPAQFQESVKRDQINCTMLVPTQMKRILQQADIDDKVIAGIETIMYGASPVSPAVLQAWIERFGQNISQLYGQAEAPMCISTLPKALHSLSHPERLASCGLPNIGVQVAVLREDGTKAEVGESGELCTRSPCVMDGYFKRTEDTRVATDGGWLHTGDLGYRDADGFFYIVGRSKEMIISGGFNVYPKEIEDLISQHPLVEDVAVIGVPDDDWGEAVKAFVVPKSGADLDSNEIVALVRDRKGPVHAPKSVELIDVIPTTAVGKPDKKALREEYWSGRDRSVA